MQELIARWDGFLGQIKQRFEGIMEESRQGCAMLLQQADYDPSAMSNAWMGMELRAKDLTSKISDTWSESVEDKFDDADAPVEVIDRERDKGDAMIDWIDVELERTRIQIYADAARQMWGRAKQEEPDSIQCTQCGASLAVPQTFQAVNVTCQYCQAVNTYEPGGRIRMIEHFCVHPLTEEASWTEWMAMKQAEDNWRGARNETLQIIQAYEAAQITYWRKYLEVRATMLPQKAADIEKDLRGKLAQWYDQIQHEKAWAAAGRPRALT